MGKMNGLFGKLKGKGKSGSPDGGRPIHPESTIDVPMPDDKPENTSEGNQMQQPEKKEELVNELNIDSDEIEIEENSLDPESLSELESLDEQIDADSFFEDLDETESVEQSEGFFAGLDDELLEPSEPELVTEMAEPEPVAEVKAAPQAVAVKDTKQKKKKEPKPAKVKAEKPKKVKEPKKAKEPKVKKQKASAQPKTMPVVSINSNDCQMLVDSIVKSCSKMPGILFAGAGTETLPLTLPVNTAIQLSKKGKKCLIIDLDMKRDAIAAAFDISTDDNKNFIAHAYDTSFENLKVWPAHNFAPQTYVSINSLIEAAAKKYDYILVNVPYLDGHVDRKLIASSSACAFMFTETPKQQARLTDLLTNSKCRIISSLSVAG